MEPNQLPPSKKKPGYLLRQPGSLFPCETLGFPSPPHRGFALIHTICKNYSTNLPQTFLMGLTNYICKLALDSLIQTMPNPHQFSKNMDYCAFSGLLLNISSGNGKQSFAFRRRPQPKLWGRLGHHRQVSSLLSNCLTLIFEALWWCLWNY